MRGAADDRHREYFPSEVAATYRDAGLWGTRTIADEFHAVALAHPRPRRRRRRAGPAHLRRARRPHRPHRRRPRRPRPAAGRPGDRAGDQPARDRRRLVRAAQGRVWSRSRPSRPTAATRSPTSAGRSGRGRTSSKPGTRGIDLVGVRPRAGPRPPDDAPRPRPRRPPDGRPRSRRGPRARRGDPARHRPRRRRRLPALRRHHRGPEADPAPARRVLVQRPRLRRRPRLDRRRPRRAPHPDHPQRRDRRAGVHAPHSVGACLVLTDHDLDTAMPILVAERTTSVLFGHAHYRAPHHPLYDAARRDAARRHALRREGLRGALHDDRVAAARRSGSCSGWPRACSS